MAIRLAGSRGVESLLILAGVLAASPEVHGQELVSFPTADDGVVFADLYGTGFRGLILAHGGRFDKSSWKSEVPVFAEAGLRVLAIDFRGRGESRAGRAGADALPLDVLAAVRYLRQLGVESVAILGASLGGWAAAEAVLDAEPGEVDRVILLAHSPISAPERLPGRKLFIVSRGDTTGAGVSRLDVIREQYILAPDPKELLVLEGNAHAQFLFETEEGERLTREILRFLLAP